MRQALIALAALAMMAMAGLDVIIVWGVMQ